MQASAAFVSASALGMACGPAVAGLLQAKFKIFVITMNANTLPGWVMALAWCAYLIWLLISFKEPSHDIEENSPQETNAGNFIFPSFYSMFSGNNLTFNASCVILESNNCLIRLRIYY